MTIAPGVYVLGPDVATLTVKTRKTGAAAKAGHNLVIEVTAWQATLDLAAEPEQSSISLSVDSSSLRVREGHGGMMALGREETDSIEQSMNEEILKGTAIEFRSSAITPSLDGSGLAVSGELELHGKRRPIDFELAVGDDGAVSGSTTIKQSDWGMKPYSALFGTLKVVDDVEILVHAALRAG